MYPHVKLGDGIRHAILDAQMTSRLDDLISSQHRQSVAGILETESLVNAFNLADKVILKKRKKNIHKFVIVEPPIESNYSHFIVVGHSDEHRVNVQ